MPLWDDITGRRNGRLVAESFAGIADDGHALWLCRCDCGGSKVVQSNNLTRGATGTQSCGCLRKEAAQKRLAASPTWNVDSTYAIAGGAHVYRSRQAWAKAVIRHYGDKCRRCGWSEARCDAHHVVPRARGGANTIANGTVLCPNCHRVLHEEHHALHQPIQRH